MKSEVEPGLDLLSQKFWLYTYICSEGEDKSLPRSPSFLQGSLQRLRTPTPSFPLLLLSLDRLPVASTFPPRGSLCATPAASSGNKGWRRRRYSALRDARGTLREATDTSLPSRLCSEQHPLPSFSLPSLILKPLSDHRTN